MDMSVLIGAAMTCVAGGFLPWINSEIVVVGASFLLPPAATPALVLMCAIGQMASKATIYGLTRWAPERLPERARRLIARAEHYRGRRIVLGTAIVSGSLVAIPPFYLVTLACGVLRVPFAVFGFAGLFGTSVRYGVLVWIAAELGT